MDTRIDFKHAIEVPKSEMRCYPTKIFTLAIHILAPVDFARNFFF